MDDLNEVRLRGRLAADPQVRLTQRGDPVATFRLEINTPGSMITDYPAVVAFGSIARVAQDLHKGDPAEVVGRLQTRSWTSADGGKHAWKTETVATSVEPLELRTPVVALDE